MKRVFQYLKTTFLTGFAFLFPFYFLIYIFLHLWKRMQEVALKFADQVLPVRVFGIFLVTVITLVVMSLLMGIVVNLFKLGMVSVWLEKNLLKHLSFYSVYTKAFKLREVNKEINEQRFIVAVKIEDHERFGLAFGAVQGGRRMVALYEQGDKTGAIVNVLETEIRRLPVSVHDFEELLEAAGVGNFDPLNNFLSKPS